MGCPFCGSSQITVVNSRPTRSDSQIWRRRRCLTCGDTFTTYEKINLSHVIVVKKSGRKQRFNRAKLYAGVYRATIDKKSSDKGEMSQFSEEIVNSVELEILKLKTKRIDSVKITETILNILRIKSLDTFLRFLAYREGDDQKKLKLLLKKYL